jgi:hypothetical protein
VTPEQRIDAALDAVLKASGSALKNYAMPKTLADMREAMRKVMLDAYIKGSNDNFEAMKKAGHSASLSGGAQVKRGARCSSSACLTALRMK